MRSMTYDPAGDNWRWHIEEKMDGSSLSICGGVATIRTAAASKYVGTDYARYALSRLTLNPEYKYYGEAFRSAHHNWIAYSRMPRHYFICYDIYDCRRGAWLTRAELEAECILRTLEPSRVLYTNTDAGTDPHAVARTLMRQISSGRLQSMLGGVPEGIVLKNPIYVGSTGPRDRSHHASPHYLGAKWERDDLVEAVNGGRLHAPLYSLNISADEFIRRVGALFNTPARRRKAEQHLAERGLDITDGALADEMDLDFDREYKAEVTQYLYNELGDLLHHHARGGLGHIGPKIE